MADEVAKQIKYLPCKIRTRVQIPRTHIKLNTVHVFVRAPNIILDLSLGTHKQANLVKASVTKRSCFNSNKIEEKDKYPRLSSDSPCPQHTPH